MFDFCRHPPPEFSAFSRDMRKKMLGSDSLEPVAGLARHPRKWRKFYRSPKLKSGTGTKNLKTQIYLDKTHNSHGAFFFTGRRSTVGRGNPISKRLKFDLRSVRRLNIRGFGSQGRRVQEHAFGRAKTAQKNPCSVGLLRRELDRVEKLLFLDIGYASVKRPN